MKGMQFELRDYQQSFVYDLSVAVSQHKHVIGQSPGGTGKTPVFIQICRNANNKGRSALILTDRVKVYEQALIKSGGIGIKGESKNIKIQDGKTYICTAQTLRARPKILEQFNKLDKEHVCIVDECHISTSNNVLNQLTNRLTIGFSATPHWKWAKFLPDMYNECVTTQDVDWFIENAYLCDYQHICRQSSNKSDLVVKNGEFTEQSQRKFFGTDEHYKVLFEDLNSVSYNKCIFFTASIKHAEECYVKLTNEGFRCSIVHSKRSDENYQVKRFEMLHETNIIISVGTLTTGYDYSDIDLVVLYRATTSLPLYLQMCFRGDRPKEGMFFRVLDYGMNGETHGAYNAKHNWKELWKEPKKKKKKESGVAGIKICPKCDSMIFIAAKFCKYCGFELPESEKPKDIGELVEMTNKFELLKGKRISQLTPQELVLYANLRDKKQFAIRVARAKEQVEIGWIDEFAKFMGYKPKWAGFQRGMITNEKIEFNDFII